MLWWENLRLGDGVLCFLYTILKLAWFGTGGRGKTEVILKPKGAFWR